MSRTLSSLRFLTHMAAAMAMMDGGRNREPWITTCDPPVPERTLGLKWIANTETLTVRTFIKGGELLENEILVYGDTEKKAIKNLKLKLKHG